MVCSGQHAGQIQAGPMYLFFTDHIWILPCLLTMTRGRAAMVGRGGGRQYSRGPLSHSQHLGPHPTHLDEEKGETLEYEGEEEEKERKKRGRG